MATRSRPPWVEAAFPLPFLLVAAGMNLGIWQNDADFLRGDVQQVEAIMVDAGPLERRTSRPRYSPTFQPVAGGAPFTLTTQPFVADELPPLGKPVVLLCSRYTPTHCRTPASQPQLPNYAFTGLWTLLSIGTAALIWQPMWRRRRRRAG
ncbi:hypothetical protein [Roseateles sp. LYH14W]|uniref:SURF1-like protein n=1 Tax=Pelomonas parva TaxID=3299032 RepID=A0ABW7F267_9BURK